MTETTKPLLSVREMAALLDMTTNALYKRIDRGTIPEELIIRSNRKGGKIEFRRAAVLRWLGEEAA